MLTIERGSRCPAHTQYTTITIIRKASTPPAIARAVTCNVVIANQYVGGAKKLCLKQEGNHLQQIRRDCAVIKLVRLHHCHQGEQTS